MPPADEEDEDEAADDVLVAAAATGEVKPWSLSLRARTTPERTRGVRPR